jgi:hypothetical protein
MGGEKCQELGRPEWFLRPRALVSSTTRKQVGVPEMTSRVAEGLRESDQLTVL